MVAFDRRLRTAAVLTLAALIVRLALAGAPGQRYDVAAFAGWAISLAHQAPWQFQSGGGYPPGYFVVLLGIGRLYAFIAAHGGDQHALLLRVMVKLPPIIADLADAWLIGALAGRFAPRLALFAGAAWLFNPVAIIDSAYWGQIDSVPWAPALAALLLVLSARSHPDKTAPRFAWAWVAFAISLLIKPQAAPVGVALIVAVLFAPRDMVRRSVLGSAAGIAGGLCVGWGLAALFSGHLAPVAAARWLVHELTFATSGFSFTSANAYNLWAVALPFYIPDTVRIGGLSLASWGLALSAVSALAVVARFAQLRSDRALVELAALVSLASFMLPTRMHERYVEGALMLVIALVGCGRQWVAAGAILTITATVNLFYALVFSGLFDPYDQTKVIANANVRDFWPLVSHPLAIVNVVVFGVLLYGYLRPTNAAAGAQRRRSLPLSARARSRS